MYDQPFASQIAQSEKLTSPPQRVGEVHVSIERQIKATRCLHEKITTLETRLAQVMVLKKPEEPPTPDSAKPVQVPKLHEALNGIASGVEHANHRIVAILESLEL